MAEQADRPLREKQDDLLKVKLTNISDTQKRFNRVFGLIYIILLIFFSSWYAINFESSEIDSQIQEIDKALAIKKLQPWDQYLKENAACFGSYYLEFTDKIVTPERLIERIDWMEKENKTKAHSINAGMISAYPVAELRELLDSPEHWRNVTTWAQRDTLVSFLFGIDYYLTEYLLAKRQAYYNMQLDLFWNRSDSLNPVIDSLLTSFFSLIDSLKKPFEVPVGAGWNPFLHNPTLLVGNLWGYATEFNNYTTHNIGQILMALQKMNYLSRFKREFVKNKKILERVRSDLERILSESSFPDDSIKFSRYESDIRFYELSTMIRSDLFSVAELPDTVQIPMFSNCEATYSDSPLFLAEMNLAKFYFPEYVNALDRYRLDKFSALKNVRDLLAAQRGNARQKIQTLGVEISSRSIFSILPAIMFILYCFVFMLIYHCSALIEDHRHWASAILESPTLIGMKPRTLGLFSSLFPALFTTFMLMYQLSSGDRRMVLHSSAIAMIMGLLFCIACLVLFIMRRKLLAIGNERSVPTETEVRDSPV